MGEFDFTGWATKANLKCSDGRTIMKDAFKDNDGQTVPLVWNHQHNDPNNILGHALLENRDEGVYAYCKFNDSETGQTAKLLVQHGDINALSIYANQLKENMSNVLHGNIREVSLVLAGANPGASIQSVIKHGDESDEEAVIFTGEEIALYHSDDESDNESEEDKSLEHADDKKEDDKKDTDKKDNDSKETDDDKTLEDVFNTFTDEQKEVVYAIVGEAIKEGKKEAKSDDDKDEESKGGDKTMKHNVFDQEETKKDAVLSHSDQEAIISMAKTKGIGSLQDAIVAYAEDNKNTLAHGIDDIESLFPEYRDVRPGAPEFLDRDQGWVGVVMNKVHKSPFSRIRTRQADIRDASLRGRGYQKGKYKQEGPNFKLLKRTTDPQTVYRKDALNRDDIVDITDFDVVEYQYKVMRRDLNEELATAIMIGDGRDEGDEAKIFENHIRPIWLDDDLYTIHQDVDIEASRQELQGTDTGKHFGDNYVYAEAIVTAALYSREQYKGSGNLEFYCTPHLLNVMLLARDLNGRRIYSSQADLAAALNVSAIHTAEQFDGKIRTTSDSRKKKLLGIFVNLSDYSVGSTKGGEITRFNQFDIDFNQEKYLIETRLSGALTRAYSAICLEEDVTDEG